jgi:hypothetical protein
MKALVAGIASSLLSMVKIDGGWRIDRDGGSLGNYVSGRYDAGLTSPTTALVCASTLAAVYSMVLIIKSCEHSATARFEVSRKPREIRSSCRRSFWKHTITLRAQKTAPAKRGTPCRWL